MRKNLYIVAGFMAMSALVAVPFGFILRIWFDVSYLQAWVIWMCSIFLFSWVMKYSGKILDWKHCSEKDEEE